MASKTDHKIVLTAVDKTQSALKSAAAGFGKVKSAIFSVQGALAGLGAIAALRKFSQDIDTLGKTAAKLGIATSELQGLRHAAELSGVATNTLDMAMQRFTRRLAEARNGTGEAKSALEEMGVALIDNQGNARAQTDVLADVADALKQVPDQADRVRLAFKLFDSEGVALVNMLENGSAGLKQMTDDFHELGMAVSAEEVAKVEAFNDSMQKLGTLFGNIGQKITAAVVPGLQSMIAFLGDKLLAALIAAVKGLQSFFDFFVDGFNRIADATDGFIDRISGPDFTRAIESLEKTREAFKKAVGPETQLDIILTNDALDEQKAKVFDLIPNIVKWGEATKKTGMTLIDVRNRAIDGMERSLEGLISGTMSVKEAFSDMARSVISDLIKMQIQRSITGPLFNMLNPSPAPISQGTLAAVPGRAMGGPVTRNKPYFVGERGPELFVPSGSGSVVPNNEIGGSGGAVNVTLNISTGVSQTVRAEIAQLMPQIAAATKQAVVDARRRGGSFASAFGG